MNFKRLFFSIFLIFSLLAAPVFAVEQQHVVTFGQNLNFSMDRLDEAITKIGSTAKASIVLRYGTWNIDKNITITSNINFQIPPGAVLDGPYTLTIQGPFSGSKGCFGSSLTVVFASGSVDEVLPKWFNETYLSSTRTRASIATSKIPICFGKNADDPTTTGWGASETGSYWYNAAGVWKWWNGTAIVEMTGGTGATDHGTLTGMADDDHTQYLNTTRHDVVARHPLTVGGTGAITAAAARTNLSAARAAEYDARDYATLELANTAAYNDGKLLIIAQNHTLTANTVLTAKVKVLPGGSFTKASTYTLTINGSFSNPNNGQCFIGFTTGVSFASGAIKEIPPEWWQTNTTPGTTDMASALQSAMNASLSTSFNTNFPIILGSGKYLALTQLTGMSGMIMRGAGPWDGFTASATRGSVIVGKHTGNAVLSLIACNYVRLQDLMLWGDQTTPPKTVLLLGRSSAASASNHVFDRVSIDGYSTVATIYSIGSESNSYINSYIYNRGGGAIRTYYTSQADGLSIGGLTGASNIDHRFWGTTIGTDQTDAAGTIIDFHGGASSGLFYFENGIMVGSAGSYISLETGGTDGQDTPGPIVFKNIGGELGVGGIPVYGFSLSSTANRAIKQLIIDKCVFPAVTTRHINAGDVNMSLYFADINSVATLESRLPNVYNSKLIFHASDLLVSSVVASIITYDISGGKKLISTGAKGNNIIQDVGGGYPTNLESRPYSTAAPSITLFGKNRVAWHDAAPTLVAGSNQNSWRRGDVINNRTIASAQPSGWRCAASGTFSTAATTGGITTGTPTLVVAAATGFYIGDYITIAGVTGIFEIINIVSTTFTLDGNANATVAGAAVVTPDPIFGAMANLP